MALVNKKSKFESTKSTQSRTTKLLEKRTAFSSPATLDPLNNSYQTALFAERVGSLSSYSGFLANNNQGVPGNYTPEPAPDTNLYLVTETNNYLMTENNNNLIT